MSFGFSCPICHAEMEAEEEWAGFETLCPECHQRIPIPFPVRKNSEVRKSSAATSRPPDSSNHVPAVSSRRKWLLAGGGLGALLLLAAGIGVGYSGYRHLRLRIAEERQQAEKLRQIRKLELERKEFRRKQLARFADRRVNDERTPAVADDLPRVEDVAAILYPEKHPE